MRSAIVVTYHSGNIAVNDHATNDLVALEQDLATIRALGFPIVPARTLAEAVARRNFSDLPNVQSY